MSDSVCPQTAVTLFLSHLVQTGKPLDGAVVHGTKSALAINKATTLAALQAIEADYGDYSTMPLTVMDAALVPADQVQRGMYYSTDLNSAAGADQAIYAVFVVGSDSTTLIGAAAFEAPQSVARPNSGVPFQVNYPWGAPRPPDNFFLDLASSSHFDRTCLTSLGSDSVTLQAAKAHLTKAPFTPTKTMSLANLTAIEADFDGYAAKSIVWLGALVNPATGIAYLPGTSLEWTPTGSVTPNTIYAVYVTNTAGDKLLFVQPLDAPVNLQGVDTGFVHGPTLTWGT